MIISVLWIIFGVILGGGSVYSVLNKKIKKLSNVLKNHKDSIIKGYQSYFDKWCKNRSHEIDRLYSENKFLYDQNCELRYKLSDFYRSYEFIKINRKIKKYKKKLKKMYKLLPYYNNIVDTFLFLKDKF